MRRNTATQSVALKVKPKRRKKCNIICILTSVNSTADNDCICKGKVADSALPMNDHSIHGGHRFGRAGERNPPAIRLHTVENVLRNERIDLVEPVEGQDCNVRSTRLAQRLGR
jgi:hypothetical protein